MFKKIVSILKSDSFIVGLIIGIVLPLILYGILHFINVNFTNWKTHNKFLSESTTQILGIAVNALTLRYYLIKRKADKTGRGIMFVTFVLAILFFAINLK